MNGSDFVGTLHGALDAAAPYALPAVLSTRLQEAVGAKDVRLLLADYGERFLELVPGGPDEDGQSVPIDGTRVGDVFRSQEPVVAADEQGHRLYLPVTVRAERLGVLEILLPALPPDDLHESLAQAAIVVGYVIATARRYTDMFEKVRRRRDLILAAEIQWELLPVLAYDCPEFAVAGALEPAYAIAGDSFDYAVEADHLQVAITDGMGHGLRAALLGSLAVSALRHARRRERGVLQQFKEANQVVHDQFGGDQFVTGTVLDVEMATGEATAVNAGHPQPWLVRAARIAELSLYPDFPLGLFNGVDYRQQTFSLEPGDRLLLVSDGVIEATDPQENQFGTERLVEVIRASLGDRPTEVVRRITGAVLEHRQVELRDDATVVCLDWRRS
jgi:serine phosphatase RsbU (regulator of sigma subunit)